jgi:preprotein translocase subunit SecG
MKSKINKAMDKFYAWFYSTKVEDALNKIFLWAAIAFVIDVILLATGIL